MPPIGESLSKPYRSMAAAPWRPFTDFFRPPR
jgi:hypothetical protein